VETGEKEPTADMDDNKSEVNPTDGGEWGRFTPEQKREQRIAWWRSSAETINFVSAEAGDAYKGRMERLIDVYSVREPDRVPVSLHIGSIPLYASGTDYYNGMYDDEKLIRAYDEFNKNFSAELDTFFNPGRVPSGKALEILDYRLYNWPGHGLSKNTAGFQFVEGEYMQAEEYDALIQNPADFWMRTYLPRIFGAFDSFRLFHAVTDIIEMPMAQLMPLSLPQVQTTLQKLIDAGRELQKRVSVTREANRRALESGYPTATNYFCKAPFDVIGDAMRGTQGIMKDIFRHPDKLLKAMDVIADLLITSTITRANLAKGLMAMFPLHKGADGWMSSKQFNEFYWPSLKKVINALNDEGLMVVLFAEGSYNTRLESINEFPKGFVHWWFDQTDMAKAKEVLGDRCCLQGNVPSSLLMTGTPAEVKEHSRKLIETCGRGGGYILCSGAANVDAKIENLRAIVEAAKEYGVYKRGLP
jgi:uroporphyrinogen-III decarboxylase